MKKLTEPLRGGGSAESRSIERVKVNGRPADSLRDGGTTQASRAVITKKPKATDSALRDGGAKLRRKPRPE